MKYEPSFFSSHGTLVVEARAALPLAGGVKCYARNRRTPLGETGKIKEKKMMNKYRKKTTATLLIAVFMVSMVASAMPVSASSILQVGKTGETYDTISAALFVAVDGDTIIVHAGTYEEDLVIEADIELMPFEDDLVTIKGVALSVWLITTYPNINVLADGVKIHGFIIQGPDPVGTSFAAGMIIGAQSVEIYDNAFEVMNANDEPVGDDISQGIVTWNVQAMADVDVSGLNIHDNTFTHDGTGTIGYEGIYINRDTGTGAITISDNTFSGMMVRGVTVERSDASITGNTFTPTEGWRRTGVLVMDLGGFYGAGCELQDNIDVTGNTISGFGNGIKIGPSDGSQVLTNIDVERNTLDTNEVGVLVRSSAGGINVNLNNILTNSLYGVKNLDTNPLDAKNNWWGTTSEDEVKMKISGNVDYTPWLIGDTVSERESASLDVSTVYPMVKISVLDDSISFEDIVIGGYAKTEYVSVEHTGSLEITQTVSYEVTDVEGSSFYGTYLTVLVGGVPFVTESDAINYGFDVEFTLTLEIPGVDVVEPGEYSGSIVFWAEYDGMAV